MGPARLGSQSRSRATAEPAASSCSLTVDSHVGPAPGVCTSKAGQGHICIKALKGQYFKSGSLLARKPFLLKVLFFLHPPKF